MLTSRQLGSRRLQRRHPARQVVSRDDRRRVGDCAQDPPPGHLRRLPRRVAHLPEAEVRPYHHDHLRCRSQFLSVSPSYHSQLTLEIFTDLRQLRTGQLLDRQVGNHRSHQDARHRGQEVQHPRQLVRRLIFPCSLPGSSSPSHLSIAPNAGTAMTRTIVSRWPSIQPHHIADVVPYL